MKRFLLLILIIILVREENPAYGQQGIISDNHDDRNSRIAPSELQAGDIRDLYFSQVSYPREIVYGKEYLSYYYRSNVIPLLNSGKEFNATLILNGRKYENILLQYDTFLDEVIYTDTSMMINFQFPKIALNKNAISSFTLYTETGSMQFEYVKFPSSGNAKFQDGFYEIAYNGRVKLLIKHVSKEYTTSQALINYEYTPQMLVFSGNEYYRLKGKRSLISIFSNSTDDFGKQLKEAGIKSKITDKNQVINVLKYFDALPVEGTDQL
jgi:hypothetical protein